MFMKIAGEKILLRDWQMQDLTTYVHWNTGHFAWMDYNGPYYDNLTQTELEARVNRLRQLILNNNFKHPRREVVIADKNTNELLGTVSWYWQSKETNWLSCGLVIYNNNYWGKGIGFDALKLWSTYLFNIMPEIVRLDMRTWSGHSGMMRLAEKLGYKLEARFRNARIVNGQFYDSIGYGVLRSEWKWF